MQLTIASPGDMESFAACCAGNIGTASRLYLWGELGAGKTTFVRGLLRALGYQGIVKSPTYTLVEPYEIAHCRIYHFDLYRISTPDELEDIGCRDYFDGRGICVVEWPERAGDYLPDPDLSVSIRIRQTGRDLRCLARTDPGKHYLKRIRSTWPLNSQKNREIP